MTNKEVQDITLESLRDWFKKEKWVRISSSGNIAGPCGTSKNKKNPDRCLPKAKAQSLTKGQRAATAAKKKKAGAKGKTVVKNTKKATVTREVKEQWPQEIESRHGDYIFKLIKTGSDRAKYAVIDKETGEQKGTPLFNTVDNLKAFASDYIKPKGGRQSSHFGTSETANPQDGKAAPYGSGYKKVTKEDITNLVVGTIAELQQKESVLQEDDRCTRLAKQKYDTWPSAYASGAVVRCRRGEIWKKK